MALPPTSTPTGKSVRQRLQALDPTRAAAFRQYVANVGQPMPAPAPAGQYPAFVLPSSAEAQYLQQRQGVNETYMGNTAENQFNRQQTALGYDQQQQDLRTQYLRMRNMQPDQFVARGIQGSGIDHENLSQMVQDRLSQVADLGLQRSTALGNFDLTRQRLERQRALALANLAANHQANLAMAAARSVR